MFHRAVSISKFTWTEGDLRESLAASMQNNLKQTILCQVHESMGAKMVEFAGWRMPVQYVGLKEEHLAVRKNVGLFDVSHMGEIRVKGPKALETLEWLTTNHVASLELGMAHYSLLPNAEGGLVDDIIIYCIDKGADYLVCVNAANTEKDWNWFVKHNKGADLTNESDLWAQIAVQGPKALELLSRVMPEFKDQLTTSNFTPFRIYRSNEWKAFLATTGYTGEIGGEVFVPQDKAVAFWNLLLEKGKDLGVQAIGLGARDTLRTEMKYSLYGHEISGVLNPYAAGLGWVIKPKVKDFLGKEQILASKTQAEKSKLAGFKLKAPGIPRQDYKLFSKDGSVELGWVTSGTQSPSLNIGVGLGYLEAGHSALGTEITVDIRGRKIPAEVCATPFVETSLTQKK